MTGLRLRRWSTLVTRLNERSKPRHEPRGVGPCAAHQCTKLSVVIFLSQFQSGRETRPCPNITNGASSINCQLSEPRVCMSVTSFQFPILHNALCIFSIFVPRGLFLGRNGAQHRPLLPPFSRAQHAHVSLLRWLQWYRSVIFCTTNFSARKCACWGSVLEVTACGGLILYTAELRALSPSFAVF